MSPAVLPPEPVKVDITSVTPYIPHRARNWTALGNVMSFSHLLMPAGFISMPSAESSSETRG